MVSRRHLLKAAALAPLALAARSAWRAAAAQGRSPLAVAGGLMDNPALVGKTRFTYLFWDVYDAFLFAPEGRYAPDRPHMLALRYLRELDGAAIVDRSIEEMRRQGPIAAADEARWRAVLTEGVGDVAPGVTLACFVDGAGAKRLFRDGVETARADDPELARRFVAIWLGADTSQPDLRQALLGAA